jgi:aspartate/methionine/tyrosine aminotransferase
MSLHPEAVEVNERLSAVAPAVLDALSPLGKRIFFPRGIPFQSAQARNCRISSTLGQLTDGAGNPLPLAPLAEKLSGLPAKDVFLYAPIQGRDNARKAWHEKLSAEDPRMVSVGLGQVCAGICHALSLGAELFFGEGDTMVLPDMHWDSYGQILGARFNGKIVTYPFYGDDWTFNIEGLASALASVEGKVHTILNFPSNPTGFSPTPEAMLNIAQALDEAARDRAVIAFCDDAYHGLVYEKEAATKSLFFELLQRRPNLIALKCDGMTKELSFFGGRVACVHFGVSKEASEILVSKCMGLIRAGIGGTVSISQVLLEMELADPRHRGEAERIRLILEERYRALKQALSKGSRHWTVLPFNSGYFCLLKLREGIDAEELRQKLIKEESVGVISHGSDHIRLAFCSLRKEDVGELVEALERACEGM